MAIAIIFLLVAAWIGQGQSQCTLEQLENNLGPTDTEEAGGLVSTGLVEDSQAQAPPVQIFQYQTVCLAAGGQRGTYSGASVVVNYTCTGIPECTTASTDGFVVTQFDLMCSGNQWIFVVAGSSVDVSTTPPDGSLSTPQRTDCYRCINNDRPAIISDQETHCAACHSSCNVGLMLCTDMDMDDCCSYYDNDTCVSECPAPTRPSDENFCSLFCDPLTRPENGMPIVLSNGVEIGSVATYSCNVGYNLVGDETRTCVVGQSSTMWNNSEPMCQIVDCGDLENPVNGQVSFEGGTVFNATATYTCDSTSELTIPDENTRMCSASGEWTGAAATCKCKSGYKEGDDSGKCEFDKKSGLTPGGIAGIVVASVAVGVIILAAIVVIIIVVIIYKKSGDGSKVKNI